MKILLFLFGNILISVFGHVLVPDSNYFDPEIIKTDREWTDKIHARQRHRSNGSGDRNYLQDNKMSRHDFHHHENKRPHHHKEPDLIILREEIGNSKKYQDNEKKMPKADNQTDGLKGKHNAVVNFGIGTYHGFKQMAMGLYDMVRHPIEFAQDLGNVVAHPITAVESLVDDIHEDIKKNGIAHTMGIGVANALPVALPALWSTKAGSVGSVGANAGVLAAGSSIDDVGNLASNLGKSGGIAASDKIDDIGSLASSVDTSAALSKSNSVGDLNSFAGGASTVDAVSDISTVGVKAETSTGLNNVGLTDEISKSSQLESVKTTGQAIGTVSDVSQFNPPDTRWFYRKLTQIQRQRNVLATKLKALDEVQDLQRSHHNPEVSKLIEMKSDSLNSKIRELDTEEKLLESQLNRKRSNHISPK